MTELREQRADAIRKAIENVATRIGADDCSFTVADLVRLLQLEKELAPDEPRKLTVRWLNPQTTENGTER
jgi:hypothetical protein